jgi:hypothetical protein
LFRIGNCTNKKIEPVPVPTPTSVLVPIPAPVLVPAPVVLVPTARAPVPVLVPVPVTVPVPVLPVPVPPVPVSTSLLTSFINNITLSSRTIAANGPTPEDQALNYLIVNDTTFNISQLLELNSMMTNMVQFRIRQRYALLTLWFQQAFTNTTWTTRDMWLNGNECSWTRITCESIDLGGTVGMQVVTEVDLIVNNVKGTIPADLGLLTALTYFNVGGNELTGTLPVSIGQWTALYYFSVSGNALTGTLPASIGQWTALTDFSVGVNALTGTLPASIGQWTALKSFNVVVNALTGTIPASIGNWSQIMYAYFYVNEFTGTMPNGICPYINATIFEELWADCLPEITCPCCTDCYVG